MLLNRPRAQRLAALVGVFLVSAALGVWWKPDSVAMEMLTDPMLFEFLGGCAPAWAVHAGVERASRRVLTRLWSRRGHLPALATPR